jgi:hypothetical protein
MATDYQTKSNNTIPKYDRFVEDNINNHFSHGDNGRLEGEVGETSPIISKKFDYNIAELVMDFYHKRIEAYRHAYEDRSKFLKLFSRHQKLEKKFPRFAMSDTKEMIKNITPICDLNIFCYANSNDFGEGEGYYRLN